MSISRTLIESTALGFNPRTSAGSSSVAYAVKQHHYLVQGLINDGNRLNHTGTDNTAQLQAEINYAIYTLGVSKIVIPAGNYVISDTIHIGYGIASVRDNSPYISVAVEGASGCGVNTGSGGTNFLWAGPFDRPMFAITGGRQVRLRKMALQGSCGYFSSGTVGEDYIHNQGLEASWNVANSYSVTTWLNPAWSVAGTGAGKSGGINGVAGAGTGTSITAPWCAIAVDPYAASTPPSPAYPNVTFPAGLLSPSFLASPYQYAKANSSDTQFEDLFISSFNAGIVICPNGESNQSDFNKFTRLWIQNCVYGISVNGSNPRESSLMDSYINQCFYAICTGVHCTVGNGSAGQWGAAIVNTAFDRNIKWFYFNQVGAQYTGNVTFLNCYGENVYAIGNYGRANTGSNPDDGNIVLQSCMANFNHTGVRGVPARILETSSPAGLTIIGGSFAGYIGAFSCQVMTKQASITGMARFKKSGTPASLYEKIGDNGSGGGVVMQCSGNYSFGDYSAKYTSYDTSGTSSTSWCQNIQTTSATNLGNWYAHSFTGSRMGNRVFNPRAGSSVNMSAAFSNYTTSLTGRILTLTWNSGRNAQQLALNGYGAGDVFQEQVTGYVFYVYSSTSTTLKAVMMTGWAVNSSNVNVGGNGTASSYTMTGNNFVPQTVTVTFSSPTAFSVSGSVQGAMGSGTVGTAFSGTGGLGFTITAGSTPFANGNTITMTITYAYANGWAPDGSYITNHMNTRLFTPGTYVVGTGTSASNSITACADDSGSNTNVATALPVGVVLYADGIIDNQFTNCGAITANSGGTITLTGNATSTKTRQLGLAAYIVADAANP